MSRRFLFIPLLLIFSSSPFAQTPQKDEAAIRSILQNQVVAWNAGNLEGYMHGYWDSDSLLFIGKNGPTYGYDATLARYKKSYPDKAGMGTLTSTILSMQRLSPQYYFVVGKWALKREAGDLSGSWTLLFRKNGKSWVIISDHSS